jgi:hypothetical protein
MKIIDTINKYLVIFFDAVIGPLNKSSLLFYAIYFLVFFLLYFIHTSKTSINIFSFYVNQLKNNPFYLRLLYGISISIFCLLFIGIIYILFFVNTDASIFKTIIITTYIFIIFIMNYIFTGLLKNEIQKLPPLFFKVIDYVYYIMNTIFYIFFFCLFIYNLNEKVNLEVCISMELVILFSCLYLINIIYHVKKINETLNKNSYLFMTLNCFHNSSQESFNSDNDYNPQLNEIRKEYGANYLRFIGNIPVAFYNSSKKLYQNLSLCDFYYPGAAYSYLGDSPLNGKPNIEALEIALSKFKVRVITLDIYSNIKDEYSPRADPVVRCKEMAEGARPLSLKECFDTINKWAWLVNNNNEYCYPFILVLNFYFEYNENMYIKIYDSIIKSFSKYLMDRKYSFAGRNGQGNISLAPMSDCIGKLILVSNKYPTKTILDELINSSTNDLTNDFKILEYKGDYVDYNKIGISQDYNKNNLVKESTFNMRFFQSEPNPAYKNNAQPKAGLFNPSFQDVAQYGVQGTLMYLFVPDENLNKWHLYFKNKSNYDPILKDQSLRNIEGKPFEPQQQNPVTGIQKPQKYCIAPNGLMTTHRSNLSGGNTNLSCQAEDDIDTNYKVNTGIDV